MSGRDGIGLDWIGIPWEQALLWMDGYKRAYLSAPYDMTWHDYKWYVARITRITTL